MNETARTSGNPSSPATIRQLSAPELKAMIDSGTPFEFVDVRTDEERAIAAIEGSRLLDKAYHDYLLTLDRDTPSCSSATTASAARGRRRTACVRDFAISTTCAAASTSGRCSWIRRCRGVVPTA